MEITFNCLPLYQTSEIFSCLFVKFVLYTAGFLGEGTLLILSSGPFYPPVRFILQSFLSPSRLATALKGIGGLFAFLYFASQNTRPVFAVGYRPRFVLVLYLPVALPPPCTLMWFQFPSETLGSGPLPRHFSVHRGQNRRLPCTLMWFQPPSETLFSAPGSKRTTAVHSDVAPVSS